MSGREIDGGTTRIDAARSNSGFFDPSGARRVVRRLKARDQMREIVASGQALLDVLEHDVDTDRRAVSTLRESGFELASRYRFKVGKDFAIAASNSKTERERNLLEGSDLVLQFLDTFGIALRHDLFSLRCDRRVIPNLEDAHRLSGDGK